MTLLRGFLLLLSMAPAAWSQLSETDLRNFPRTPAQGFVAIKNFDYVGDYQYKMNSQVFPTPNIYARPTGYGHGDLSYFKYTGLAGKKTTIWVSYAGTRPTSEGNCMHTHLQFGLKGKWSFTYNGKSYTGWSWMGGGTMSGVWNATAKTCSHKVVNSLSSNPLFGWGEEVVQLPRSVKVTINGTQFSIKSVKELILAGMAPTHGSGDCLAEQGASGIKFKMCLDQFWANAYTTP